MPQSIIPAGLKPKDLCGVPERVGLAAQADGWYLRSRIIWAKPNPMPESVNGTRWERCKVKVKAMPKAIGKYSELGDSRSRQSNCPEGMLTAQYENCPGCPKCLPNGGLVLRRGSWRPTSSYEIVLMLAKSADYWSDGEGVREGYSESTLSDLRDNENGERRDRNYPGGNSNGGTVLGGQRAGGRNLRNVWTISTEPTRAAHFATFPQRLVEPCIKIGTSEAGCCSKCGVQWARVVESTPMVIDRTSWGDDAGNRTASSGTMVEPASTRTLGFRPTCTCKAESIPSTVLDPFGGSGTTARVAQRLGRSSIIIEINPIYVETIAKPRFDQGVIL